VRVKTFFAKDEKVIDVDDSNSNTFVSQDGGSGNDFVSDLDSDTDKDNIGVLTAVGRESGPNGSTGNTVTVGLLKSVLLLY